MDLPCLHRLLPALGGRYIRVVVLYWYVAALLRCVS